MVKAALKLVRTDLAQTREPLADTTPSPEQREAQRLAELAASFALFGLRIDFRDEGEWPGAAEIDAIAEQLARLEAIANDNAAEQAPAPVVAPARFAFPELTRRGWHVDPSLPVKTIQALDWAIVLVAAQFAALWGAGMGLFDLSIGHAAAFIASAGALKAGMWLTESYRTTPARIRPERGIGGLALGAILGLFIANVFAPDARSAAALAAILPVAAMLLAGIHAALAVWINAAHSKGLFAENIVLIGATEAAQRLAARAAKSGEARVVAIVDDRVARSPHTLADAPVGGSIEDLLRWDGLPHVDRIVITVTQKAEGRVRAIIEKLRIAPNRVDLLLDYDAQAVRGRGAQKFSGAAVACVSGRPHNHRRAFVKRVEDIVFGSLLLAVFAIPMLVIAAAVKLTSQGPVLYRQRRHGFNNRVITVLKFRTMRHEPGARLRQVTPQDPRITSIGGFLRQTSLDELPQLINVLRGEMSLVGPRPHAIGMTTACERELQQIVGEYAHRHRVKPGITGWAQINGSRGPIETPAAVRRRLKLDLDYVSRASLWLDLEILVRTAPALFGDTKATR